MSERQELYRRMGSERVNVEIMFARAEDEELIISCRLREWSAGKNAGRMILAGGRTLDEAVAYAYQGLFEGTWVPMDWKARAYGVGTVQGISAVPTPIRRPLDLRALVNEDAEWEVMPPMESGVNGPQNGAQSHPEGKSSKAKA